MSVVNIIVHPAENPKKCTIQHLRDYPGVVFQRFSREKTYQLPNAFILGVDGKPLSRGDAAMDMVVLDGTWRYARQMIDSFSALPVRSITGWVTAYPRVSKLYDDPDHGLATIEAIYAAFVILGKDPGGLLDHYYWKDDFLRQNDSQIREQP